MDEDLPLVFRDADPSEDEELARIMYNAFIPVWNYNWFQGLSTPLETIPSTSSPRTRAQARRLAFHRSWIALARAHNGIVTLAYTPSTSSTITITTSSSPSAPASTPATNASPAPTKDDELFTTSPSNRIAAICVLLPPHARPTWHDPLISIRVGIIQAVLGFGLRGAWRVIVTFEGNVHRMLAEGLKACGVEPSGREERLVMCLPCVRNPEWEPERGRRPGRRLFDWAVRRYWRREAEESGGKQRGTPVVLDTTTDEAVRAYEAIGFKLIGECDVDTGGCDALGLKIAPGASEEERAEKRKEARKVARQMVMVRVPEPESESEERALEAKAE